MSSQYATALDGAIRSLITDVRDECLNIVARLVIQMIKVSSLFTFFQCFFFAALVFLGPDKSGPYIYIYIYIVTV